MQLTVLKRSGATEPFTREKAVAGVRKACKGRPVTEDQLACLGQAVEDTLRLEGAAEVPAHEVGLAILGPLRALDEVAYLRFASVYRAFESADDFEDEIAFLRAEREGRVRWLRRPTRQRRASKPLLVSDPQSFSRSRPADPDRPGRIVGKQSGPGAPTSTTYESSRKCPITSVQQGVSMTETVNPKAAKSRMPA